MDLSVRGAAVGMRRVVVHRLKARMVMIRINASNHFTVDHEGFISVTRGKIRCVISVACVVS
jgi:hypothetical protein